MKRVSLLAFALFASAAAQAVTVTWDDPIALGAGEAFTAVVKITAVEGQSLNDLIANSATQQGSSLKTLLQITGTEGTPTAQFNIWPSNAWVLEASGNMKNTNGTEHRVGNIPKGTGDSITLHLSGQINAEGTSMTLNVYYEEANSGTTMTWTSTTFTGAWTGATILPDAATDDAVSAELAFVDDQYREGNDLKAIPEPTALALLALGVAGAALRRTLR